MDNSDSREARAAFPVVVHVMLCRLETVFLLQRARTGFMDGFHVLPGGHLYAGESVVRAATRECQEEAGVVASNLSPVAVLPYISGGHQGINFVFAAREWSGEPGNAEPELCDACGWFARDQLPVRHPEWLDSVFAMQANGEWFREFRWD